MALRRSEDPETGAAIVWDDPSYNPVIDNPGGSYGGQAPVVNVPPGITPVSPIPVVTKKPPVTDLWGTPVDEDGNAVDDNPLYPPEGGTVIDDGTSNDAQNRIKNLEKIVSDLLRASGGGYRAPQQLTMQVSNERSRLEAALRYGLNEGELDIEDVKKESPTVIGWLADVLGMEDSKAQYLLRSTLSAGASALTMVLTGGNFPLGAAAYFGTQALLPIATENKDPAVKKQFKGYSAVGAIDGNQLTAIDMQLPMGLPHDIFGDYRFVVYDHLTGKWFPSDEIEPVNYWSNEQYRYTCLDRVTSKVYHSNKIKAVRLYI